MSHQWTPPSWWYIDTKPKDDADYFENLTRCIFQAGLNWSVIDNKWLNFLKAFDGFNVLKISSYTEEDVNRLLKDFGIIRNKIKILATIHNAQEFRKIASKYGSFGEWLKESDKTNNYSSRKKSSYHL